jgi:hypothetical protein
MKENREYAEMLEYFDRTGKNPLKKVKKNFTIKTINSDKLRRASESAGKGMSDILDELIERNLRSE